MGIQRQRRPGDQRFFASPFIPNIVVYETIDEQGKGHRDFWIIAFEESVHRFADRPR